MQTAFQLGYGVGRIVGVVLPPLILLGLVYGVQYIRTGSTQAARQTVTARWSLIAAGALLIFGVIALVMP
jgi:hypothetical protein